MSFKIAPSYYSESNAPKYSGGNGILAIPRIRKEIIPLFEKGYVIPISFRRSEYLEGMDEYNYQGKEYKSYCFSLLKNRHEKNTASVRIRKDDKSLGFPVMSNPPEEKRREFLRAIRSKGQWYLVALDNKTHGPYDPGLEEKDSDEEMEENEEEESDKKESDLYAFRERHKDFIVDELANDPEIKTMALKKVIFDLEAEYVLKNMREHSSQYNSLLTTIVKKSFDFTTDNSRKRILKSLFFEEMEKDISFFSEVEDAVKEISSKKREREEELIRKNIKEKKPRITDDELKELVL